MTTEVSDISGPCNTYMGEDRNPDGSIQNPTILKKAKELSTCMGKKSARRILCTVWCDNNDFRKSEFERVLKVWQLSTNFMIFGPLELSEENKKPHFHGFMCWKSPKTFKTILKILPSAKYHIEPSKTTVNAVEYCIKTNPDDVLTFGEVPKQGERNDLKALLKQYDYNINDIKTNEPELYGRYRGGLIDICEQHNAKRSLLDWLGLVEVDENITVKEYKPSVVHWFWGSTGTGKTLEVKNRIRAKLLNNEVKPNEITRIDDFVNGFAIGDLNLNAKIVIIDEFRGNKLKLGGLLQLIDGANINIKGGKYYIHAEEIFITSCQPPEEAYQNVKSDKVDQLLRRLTEVKKFGDD